MLRHMLRDRLIRDQYINQCDPEFQNCDYCGAKDVACVEPPRLRQWFSTLVATYEEDVGGKPLVQLLDEEWYLFRGSGLRSAEAKELLAEILDDGEFVRKTFAKIEYPDEGALRSWEDLRDELMHQNRWFLDRPMDMGRIRELLGYLITPQSAFDSDKWYRARLMDSGGLHDLCDMGAPPPNLAKHGRANPVGIPYLYLASTRATAVAELRPHTGEHASVAAFDLAGSDLKYADLRDPRNHASPLVDDEDLIFRLRAGLPLLERLGIELTRPVQPSGAPYEYIPTQYLCEFIKTCGFDGVLYRSSVSTDGGSNVALFDPDVTKPLSVEEVAVERVSVEIGV
ncbi:RES domain-containing protein [Microbacterium sp. NIBRBAC000506063]|uniref:RES domain-containing protein n=1 Tax=Microbacterium sp. NIBRBAC000506063 TaxID=2734618 RepID=UPI001BB6EA10|nr:RES domain-containing protein [Microbacterium sp. NIBRBAC000506063]QTV78978.1 RES family NAD+ phosphorylase [Microbacterium sp. NIBRBAC000506063]